MIPVETSLIENKGGIMLTNIQHGFDSYPYHIYQKNQHAIKELLLSFYRLNGTRYCYVDFHYHQLNDVAKNYIHKHLPTDLNDILLSQTHSLTSSFFAIECEKDPMFYVIHFLTSNEILFSTFYFTNYPVTVWGNYNLSYPAFFKDKKTMDYYAQWIE